MRLSEQGAARGSAVLSSLSVWSKACRCCREVLSEVSERISASAAFACRLCFTSKRWIPLIIAEGTSSSG